MVLPADRGGRLDEVLRRGEAARLLLLLLMALLLVLQVDPADAAAQEVRHLGGREIRHGAAAAAGTGAAAGRRPVDGVVATTGAGRDAAPGDVRPVERRRALLAEVVGPRWSASVRYVRPGLSTERL